MYEIYKNKKLNIELLKKEPWLKYLVITKEKNVNVERVNRISDIDGSEILKYTLRTIELLNKRKSEIDKTEYNYILTTLKWSEVAKGGSETQRKKWIDKGYSLDIHNLASAEIYRDEYAKESSNDEIIIYTLIKTHGIIGQIIRGEVPQNRNKELYELIEYGLLSKEKLRRILLVLNYCVIAAVDNKIYEKTKKEVESIIDKIIEGNFREYNIGIRLQKLLPVLSDVNKEQTDLLKPLLKDRELWYTEVALKSFKLEEVITIFKKVEEYIIENVNGIKHISFYNIAKFLYYDYEERKKINIYKKRVVEQFLQNPLNNNHIDFEMNENNGVLMVGFKLTTACEKLIDFCVEAERTNILTYEKSIMMLFDLFEFRKDKFDRLNNEDKYLNTMNGINNTTKKDLINYVKGNVIVDVGSGGGIMLDMLESRYPDKKIIGTDISKNVIDHLNKKIKLEEHTYEVREHNFVNNIFDYRKPDTIIFSSILHEIYSYTEINGEKFKIASVKKSLKNAADSLNVGGRIIIRDGVKTNSKDKVTIKFKSEDGMECFFKFAEDFEGLKDVNKRVSINKKEQTSMMDINLAREFLYTYTWGKESYAHEVQEQFGYFTLNELVNYIEKELGFKVVVAKEFLEPGYKKHLSSLISLFDIKGNEIELPNSNMIAVFEKQINKN